MVLMGLAVILSFNASSARGQDYSGLYNAGRYEQALEKIDARLKEIYRTRVEDKRVPTGYITLRNTDRDIDLVKVFRDRKAKGFFIEENEELSTLHLYAARCNEKLDRHDYAVNHYYQCLRFRRIRYKRDDAVFYELSQIFKKTNKFKGYIDALETACTLNKEHYDYSLELGTALYRTSQKKKAIYHLKRYILSSEQTIDPSLYLMLGNLYEDTARYLETEKYYRNYLEKKPEDGFIHFALGHNAYKRTGNYNLAQKSLDAALRHLPEDRIVIRSKAHEYKGDMSYRDLEYDEAEKNYLEAVAYQDRVKADIENIKQELSKFDEKLDRLKAALIEKSDFDQYEEYEFLKDQRAKKELELVEMQKEYKKLNRGHVLWSLARINEKKEKYDDAIGYYRRVIAFDYKAGDARERIIKLQLKIKRGY